MAAPVMIFTVNRYFVAGAAGVELFLAGAARAVAAKARADRKEASIFSSDCGVSI